METLPPGVIVIGMFITALLVFLVIREVVLWYFRLNEIANNIAYIANHYRAVDRANEQQQATRPRPAPPAPTNARLAGIHPRNP